MFTINALLQSLLSAQAIIANDANSHALFDRAPDGLTTDQGEHEETGDRAELMRRVRISCQRVRDTPHRVSQSPGVNPTTCHHSSSKPASES